jgi:hypothetical protein
MYIWESQFFFALLNSNKTLLETNAKEQRTKEGTFCLSIYPFQITQQSWSLQREVTCAHNFSGEFWSEQTTCKKASAQKKMLELRSHIAYHSHYWWPSKTAAMIKYSKWPTHACAQKICSARFWEFSFWFLSYAFVITPEFEEMWDCPL